MRVTRGRAAGCKLRGKMSETEWERSGGKGDKKRVRNMMGKGQEKIAKMRGKGLEV